MAGAEPVSIGEQLRRYRMRAGLTQEELAERAGLSARAIRALETSASRSPRRDTLGLLVTALGLTPAERERLEAALRQRRMPAPLPSSSSRLATATRGPRPPLVGRERERALLDACLRGEGPRLLLLAGEPGIGKSRLLERAAERAEELGWTVVAGGCSRRSAQEPYAPCVEALARLLGTRGSAQLRMDLHGCGWLVRLLPELAEQTLAPAQSWALPPQQERRLMFAAVARVLENVAGPAGTLLLLDDLHWAGVDALDLIAFLLREVPGRRLRVVGAYRDTDVSARDPLPMLAGDLTREGLAAGVSLAPLARDEAMELLSSLFADASTEPEAKTEAEAEQVRRDIVGRAGGIPFYLVSCAEEARGGALAASERASLAEPFTVPWDAAESVRQRVALLAEPAREGFTVVAVAGRQLRREILLPVLEGLGYGERATLAALEAALRARLLEEHADGSYAFTHDLIRETVAADMSGARRAALHRRIAEAMEHLPAADQRAAELAWHFARGDAPVRALPYALQAGDQAEAMYAHSEAEGHYGAAAELARQVGDRARAGEALEKRADVLYRLVRYTEAATCLEEAIGLYRATQNWERLAWSIAQLARAGDPLGLTAASLVRLEELFGTLAAVAQTQETSDVLEPDGTPLLERQAERVASLLTPKTAARLYLCLTSRLLFLRRYDEVHTPSERAIQHARAAGDLRIESLAYGFRADAERALGQLDKATASVAQARSRASVGGDLEALYMALRVEATIAERQAEPLRARETLLSMLDVSTRLGDLGDVIDTLNVLAVVAFVLGEWDTSADYFARSAALPQGKLSNSWCSPAVGRTVLDALRTGQTGQSVSPSVTLADTEGISDAPVGAWAIAMLAEHDILAARADDTSDQLRRAIERFQVASSNAITLFAPLAWAELECGEQERARATLMKARQLAGEQRDQAALAEIERIAALLALREGRLEEARQSVERALAVCQAAPYPYAEAKARYVFGQIYAAMGKPVEANEEFTRALAICARLGERRYRAHIERALTS